MATLQQSRSARHRRNGRSRIVCSTLIHLRKRCIHAAGSRRSRASLEGPTLLPFFPFTLHFVSSHRTAQTKVHPRLRPYRTAPQHFSTLQSNSVEVRPHSRSRSHHARPYLTLTRPRSTPLSSFSMAPRGAPVFKSPKVTDDAPLATSPRSSPNVDQLTSDLEQLSPATSHSSEFSSTSGPAPISPVVTKGSRFSFSGSHPHPVRTATASSTDSTSSNKHQSSTSVSGESTKSHTGIKHAIRGAAGHHISKPKTQKVPPPFKVPDDPLALCELAISTVLTIPGPPLDELQDVIWPQLYHLGYSHRINCR